MRKGWEIKELKEIATFSQGIQVGLEKHETKQMEGYVRFIRIIDYTQNTDDIRYIPDPGEKYYVNEEDIVMVRYGSPGLVGRGKAGVIANNLFKITILRNDIINDYLTHFLSQDSIQKYLSSQGASTMPALNFGQLGKIEIKIPPLSEQKEIVSILVDAFESIELAKSNAERNLKNAKELFESYLQNIFHKKGDEWEEKKLDEIAEVEYGYTDKSKEEGHYRYIRITDIDKNGELILSEKKYINYSKEASGFIVQNNDLLMARTGATFAKVLLYDGDEPSVFASYLIRIKFKVNIENELYWYFTKTPNYWEQANSLQSGAAQPHFNGAAVKQVIFPYPKSETEQKRLIHSFQRLSKETKKLEIIYQQKLNDLEELKKSILQKAFNGELKTSKISA